MCLHCFHGDTKTQAKFTLASGRRFLLLCLPEMRIAGRIFEANQTEFSRDCFPPLSFQQRILCVILQQRFLNAVTNICSSTRNSKRVQNILICINILSNDKQVIHYNYFIHCLKYTSHSNLFRKHIISWER